VVLTALRLRTLHRTQDIGSAPEGGVNVCQRPIVNEVVGPLTTEFVRNFGREGATPYQRGFRPLGRVQPDEFLNDNVFRHLRPPQLRSAGATGLVVRTCLLVKKASRNGCRKILL